MNSLESSCPPNSEVISYTIPAHDMGEYGALPDDERLRVRMWVDGFRWLAGAVAAGTTIGDACKELAGRLQCSGEPRVSPKTVDRLYRVWRKGGRKHDRDVVAWMPGDWRMLLRDYKSGAQRLHPDTINHLCAIASRMGRDDANTQAARDLLAAWAKGESIPGLGDWRQAYARHFPGRPVPAMFPHWYPAGLSVSNLRRHLVSKRPTLKLARRGALAAHGEFQGIRRDVSQLRFMECVVIDDFQLDLLVADFRSKQTVRPQGLLAMDLATRTPVAWGLCPRDEKDDGKRRGLIREDMRTLLYNLFSEVGMPTDYPVTLVVENASAAIPKEVEAALQASFGDQVRIQRTMLKDYKALRHDYSERVGAPWQKGWIEQFFRSLHLSLGSHPGQTGPSYDRAPGRLEQQAAEALKLLRTIDEAALAKAHLPLLTWDEVIAAFAAGLDTLNHRRDHALSGFAKIREVIVGEGLPPIPFEAARANLAPAALAHAQLRERLETPAERRARMAQGACQPVPFANLRDLMAGDRPVVVRKPGTIAFKVDGEPTERIYCSADVPELDSVGSKYRVRFEPSDLSKIVLCSMDGEYLATLPALAPYTYGDHDAANAAAATTEHLRNRATAEIRTWRAADDTRLGLDRAHNADLLRIATGRPTLAAEQDDRRQEAARARRIEDATETEIDAADLSAACTPSADQDQAEDTHADLDEISAIFRTARTEDPHDF